MTHVSKSFSYKKMLKLEHLKTQNHYEGIFATSAEANRIRREKTKKTNHPNITGFRNLITIEIE